MRLDHPKQAALGCGNTSIGKFKLAVFMRVVIACESFKPYDPSSTFLKLRSKESTLRAFGMFVQGFHFKVHDVPRLCRQFNALSASEAKLK